MISLLFGLVRMFVCHETNNTSLLCLYLPDCVYFPLGMASVYIAGLPLVPRNAAKALEYFIKSLDFAPITAKEGWYNIRRRKALSSIYCVYPSIYMYIYMLIYPTGYLFMSNRSNVSAPTIPYYYII